MRLSVQMCDAGVAWRFETLENISSETQRQGARCFLLTADDKVFERVSGISITYSRPGRSAGCPQAPVPYTNKRCNKTRYDAIDVLKEGAIVIAGGY